MAHVSPDWNIALAPLAGWHEATRAPGAIAALAARFFAWRARRATVRALAQLDCATLRDLGIDDIESQVYGAPDGRKRPYDPNWWRRP